MPDNLHLIEVRTEIEQWLDFLDRWAEFRRTQEDSFEGFATPRGLGWETVEDLRRAPTRAVAVRDYYSLGLVGIHDLYSFLDQIGVLVYRAPLGNTSQMGSELITGAFFIHSQLGGCILVNTDLPRDQQIWTLAHEFAHVLYHHSTRYKVCVKSQGTDPKERFADAFAGQFLVPNKVLRQQIKRMEPLDPYKVIQLASSFQVSYGILLMRLREENAITVDEAEEWKTYSAHDMAQKLGLDPKPFEGNKGLKFPLDRYPLLVLERIREGLANEQISLGEAAQVLQVDEADLSEKVQRDPSPAELEEMHEFDSLLSLARS